MVAVPAVSPVIPNSGRWAMTIFRLSGVRRWYEVGVFFEMESGSFSSLATRSPKALRAAWVLDEWPPQSGIWTAEAKLPLFTSRAYTPCKLDRNLTYGIDR
jgi:hypothetical protein